MQNEPNSRCPRDGILKQVGALPLGLGGQTTRHWEMPCRRRAFCQNEGPGSARDFTARDPPDSCPKVVSWPRTLSGKRKLTSESACSSRTKMCGQPIPGLWKTRGAAWQVRRLGWKEGGGSSWPTRAMRIQLDDDSASACSPLIAEFRSRNWDGGFAGSSRGLLEPSAGPVRP